MSLKDFDENNLPEGWSLWRDTEVAEPEPQKPRKYYSAAQAARDSDRRFRDWWDIERMRDYDTPSEPDDDDEELSAEELAKLKRDNGIY